MHHHHALSPSPSSCDTKEDDEPRIIYSTNDEGMPVRVMPDGGYMDLEDKEYGVALKWLEMHAMAVKWEANHEPPWKKRLLQHFKTRDAEKAEERKKQKEEEKTKENEDAKRYKQKIEAANASMPRPTMKRPASSMHQASYPAMPCKKHGTRYT